MAYHYQKLIYTPKCETSTQEIIQVLKLGVRVINLDLAYGTEKQNVQLIQNINEAIEKFLDEEEFNFRITKICSIRGRIPRIGRMRNDCRWKIGTNDLLVLTSDTKYENCSLAEVSYVSNFSQYISLLQIGNEIHIHEAVLKVMKIRDNYVTCLVLESGILKSYDRLAIPNFRSLFKEPTSEEMSDCAFAVEQKFDFIVAPDVQRPQYYHTLRRLIKPSECKLIAKIESEIEASVLNKIQEHFFALYIETDKIDIETVAKKARELRKPLISSFPKETCLNHMLFMACDCFNFGCSEEAEKIIKKFNQIVMNTKEHEQINEELDEESPTAKKKVVISITHSGNSVRDVISSGQKHHLIAMTKNETVAKRLNLYRYTIPMVYVDCDMKTVEKQFEEMTRIAKKYGHKANILTDIKPLDLNQYIHPSNSCTIHQ